MRSGRAPGPALLAARAGAAAVVPMLVGVIPFGLVAGARPGGTEGLGGAVAIGLSTIVFAGASQLVATEVLADGGSALVAALAAWTVNLRLLLYSASLAPHLAALPLRSRLTAGYLLTDQAYAVSIVRWTGDGRVEEPAHLRYAYFLGAGLMLWSSWQATTIVGVLIGTAIPEELPLDAAVPLVFLVLLVPAVTSRPALAAAIGGGLGAVLAAEAGAGSLSVMVGAAAGIAAGVVAELVSP